MRRYVLILGVIVTTATAAVVVYAQGLGQVPQLVIVDRAGNRMPLGRVEGALFAPRVSPLGRRVAYDNGGGVWIDDFATFGQRRLLRGARGDRFPVWMGDERRIAFANDLDGQETISWHGLDGTVGSIIRQPGRAPESWSRQHETLSFIVLTGNSDYDIWTYSFEDRQASPFAALSGSAQLSSAFSPDGRWIAYESNEAGAYDIWVEPFPRTGTGSRVRLTTNGRRRPMWSADGRELFFDDGMRIYAATVQPTPAFVIGAPVALPITGFIQGDARRQYDLMPDGRFLMMFP